MHMQEKDRDDRKEAESSEIESHENRRDATRKRRRRKRRKVNKKKIMIWVFAVEERGEKKGKIKAKASDICSFKPM